MSQSSPYSQWKKEEDGKEEPVPPPRPPSPGGPPIHLDWLVTNRLGEFGRYQKMNYLLLGLPAITCAMHALSWVFLGANVKYRCELPGEFATYGTLPPGYSFNTSFPIDSTTGKPSQCEYLFTNETIITPKPVPCDGFVFDNSQYKTSARIDFDLICSKTYWYTVAETLFKSGILVGALLFGSLSDRLGRRPVFFYALCQQLTCGVIAAFAPNYTVFVVARFLIGVSNSGVFLVAFVIAMELVGRSKRVAAGMGMQYFFTVGWLSVGLLAYLIREWRHLQLALSLFPGILFLWYYWFLPESIRWLVTKNRKAEAVKILKRAATINKTTIPESELERLSANPPQKEIRQEIIKPSRCALLRYPKTLLRSLNIFFCWFVNSGVYYGLALNSTNLGGNDYLNFVMSGLVEIPAYAFLIFTLNVFGRRNILCTCMIIAGGFLIACGFLSNTNHPTLLVGFNMVGKMFNAAAYAAIYMYAAELFPTVIRNSCMGISSVCARIGGIIADYVILAQLLWKPAPHLIFGTVSLVSGILCLLLPETLSRRLPDTLEDSEKFGTRAYDDDDDSTSDDNSSCQDDLPNNARKSRSTSVESQF